MWDSKRWEGTPDHFQFPQVEIGHQHGLIGRVIEQINPVDSGQCPEIYINFSGGTKLVLQGFCEYQQLEFRQNDSD